jgi:ABC-type dipeptide/oligopeptide/nickel transport system ATPase subunit
MTSLVEVSNMFFHYPRARTKDGEINWTLQDISLKIEAKSTVGIVGESGSGKSTLIRVMCALLHHQQGNVSFNGQDVSQYHGDKANELRRENQIVFQNPRRSLDPRMTIRRSLSEPIRALHGRNPDDAEIIANIERVGLGTEVLSRFPHQLSGGQRQRVAIARALVKEPKVLLADEPTGNLDSRTSIEIMGIFQKLNDEGMTVVMVTHELDIAHYCKRIVVMRDGLVRSDAPVTARLNALEELQKLEAEQKAVQLNP